MKNQQKSNGAKMNKANKVDNYAIFWVTIYQKLVKINNTYDLREKNRLSEEVFSGLFKALTRIFYKKYSLDSKMEYAEMIHEGVTRIFLNFHTFSINQNPKGFYYWATKVAENKIKDLRDSAHYKRSTPISFMNSNNSHSEENSEWTAGNMDIFGEELHDFSKAFEYADTLANILNLMETNAKFNNNDITLYTELFINHLTMEEFAAQYNIKIGTVRVNLSRLRDKLKYCIAA